MTISSRNLSLITPSGRLTLGTTGAPSAGWSPRRTPMTVSTASPTCTR